MAKLNFQSTLKSNAEVVMRDLLDYLNRLPPQLVGVLMAIFIAVLRIVYDGRETKPLRIILEAIICGALSLAAGSAIVALGLNSNWILFAGGVIGYLGSTAIRSLIIKFLHHRIGRI